MVNCVYENDFNFLLDISNDGDDIYDCVSRAILLYQHKHYEMVPNAVRMFYECLIICFFGGIKYMVKDEYGNPKFKETVDDYFANLRKSDDDRYFYEQIFKAGWKDSNVGSHYVSLEKLNSTQIKRTAEELIYKMTEGCFWFYQKRKGKDVCMNVGTLLNETPIENLQKAILIKETEIIKLKNENSSLKNKNNKEILNKELQDKIVTLNKLLNDRQNENKNLEKQIKLLESKCDSKEIMNLNKEIKILLDNNLQLEKIANEEKLRNKNLEEQVVQLQAYISSLSAVEIVEETGANSKELDKDFLSKICKVIEFMNLNDAYATMTTICNLFAGVDNTPNILYKTVLKTCEYFGSYIDISMCELENYLDYMLQNNIIRKNGAKYFLNNV